MSVAPCKGCPDRHPNCHSVCKPYLDFQKEQCDTNAWLRSQPEPFPTMPATSTILLVRQV